VAQDLHWIAGKAVYTLSSSVEVPTWTLAVSICAMQEKIAFSSPFSDRPKKLF
jgi:hypothetical protein